MVADMNIHQQNCPTEAEQKVFFISDKYQLKQYLIEQQLLSLSLSLNAFQDADGLATLTQRIRELSAIEPSIGIALTMHHHIVLVLAKYPHIFANAQPLLKLIHQQEYLVASAFAEGKAGISVFNPSSQLIKVSDQRVLVGCKKPCTLSSIADHFVLSTSENRQLKLVSIPAKQAQISHKPFWHLDIFQACDSHEVIFDHVPIDDAQYCHMDDTALSDCLVYGLSLFNYLACSAYVGMADQLLSYLPTQLQSILSIRVKVIEFKQANDVLLKQMHTHCVQQQLDQEDLASVLNIRYLIEQNIQNLTQFSLQHMGGVAMIQQPEILKFANHLEMLKYHPTSKFQFYQQFN